MSVRSERKVQYPEIKIVRHTDDKELTVVQAKKILGWVAESDPEVKELFGDNYHFKDANGVKVRLENCETNRPLRLTLAKEYSNEMLRNKWRFNGESITIDCKANVQSGQHRLVGFVLAEQVRTKNPGLWKEYGTKGELTLPCLLVYGISDDDDVVDTIDLGQKRSLGDVLFRNREFTKVGDDEQKSLSNTLAGAIRLCWLCTGGKTVASAPKLSHSVALDFLSKHGELKDHEGRGLLEAVDFVTSEDAGAEKHIRTYLSLPYAAGLMYLFGTSKTDTKKYDAEGIKAIDTSNWEKAEEFFRRLATGADLGKGHPILVLRNFLSAQSNESGADRDDTVIAVKKAWRAFVEGRTLTGIKELKTEYVKDPKTEKRKAVMVYVGGLDVERVVQVPVEDPQTKTPAKDGANPAKAGKKAAKKAAKKAVTQAKGPAPVSAPKLEVGNKVKCSPSGVDENNNPYPSYEAVVKEIKGNKVKVTVGEDVFQLSLDEDKIEVI